MADRKDLLIEIGSEEVPPGMLFPLVRDLASGLQQRLREAQLEYGDLQTFATPRRLAVRVTALAPQQPDRVQTRRGPAIQAAFDDSGQPTRAAQGFARSCGVSVDALQRLETDKGAWLIHQTVEPGQPTPALIPPMVAETIGGVPLPKRMRWSDCDSEFIRPIHWIVILFGEEIVPGQVLGIAVGRETRGHRFHWPGLLSLPSTDDYVDTLRAARVMVDVAERRQRIQDQVVALASTVDGRAVMEDDLVDEVNALVEWPVALIGQFDRRFLNIPPEVLITTMQGNQRYFPVVDRTGRLMPHFITVANLESRDPAQVVAGNERVLRPRFSDAEFFWNQDRQRPLADRINSLKQVVFQQKLGSVYERGERIAALARFIAGEIDADRDHAERAGRLAKCDLVTDMVQEFPELQGVMGRYYAEHDGEHPEVAQALLEQYQPRFAGDQLPTSAVGQAVALADRLDALVGGFATGQQPSGNRDPYGLRRAALGVLRMLCEQSLKLDLRILLQQAAQQFSDALSAPTAVPSVFDFMMDRLRSYLLDQGLPVDVFEAVSEVCPTQPLDFQHRCWAVRRFRERPESISLTGANKRIRNILRKADVPVGESVAPGLLHEAAEQALAGRLAELASEVKPLMHAGLYDEALNRLAILREPVDRFFDEVMVMADDPAVRDNRLALLRALSDLFLGVADLSRLQT